MISLRAEQSEETIVLEEFERRVRRGQVAPSTMVRFPVLTGEHWVEAQTLEFYRRLYPPVTRHFGGAFTLSQFPTLTMTICLFQVGLYVALGGLSGALPLEVLIAQGVKADANVFELGETWRLLTANLLHRDVPRVPLADIVNSPMGLRVAVPARWRRQPVDALGYKCWQNLLAVKICTGSERSTDGPLRLADLRRRFVPDDLRTREEDGEITDVKLERARHVLVAGGRASALDIAFESRAGPQMIRVLLIERGYLGYKVIMVAPVGWFEAYTPLLERMTASVALVETDGLQESRRVVAVFLGMSSARVELARQLALLGYVDETGRNHREALASLPDMYEAQYGLARLAVDYEQPLDDAERYSAALHARSPDEPTFAARLADIRQRRGQRKEACEVLQMTLDRTTGEADDLRDRLRSLGCRPADGQGSEPSVSSAPRA